MDIKTFYSKIFNVFKKEVDTSIKEFKDWKQNQAQTSQRQAAQPQPAQPQQPQTQQPERSDAEWMAYFREILATEFPQYAVRENVPVQELTGDVSDEFSLWGERTTQVYKAEWGKPYDFVMYLNGVPKAAIVFGRSNQHKHKVKHLISRMYAKKLNMVYIGFYLQFPNYREYVVKRINEHLR